VIADSLRQIHDQMTGTDSMVRSTAETGRKILALTPSELAVMKQSYPALTVEEDLQYKLARSPLTPSVSPPASPASGATRMLEVEVTDAAGVPVAGADVTLLTRVSPPTGYSGTTDGNGVASFRIRHSQTTFERVIVDPHARCWSRVLSHVPAQDWTVKLDPLTPAVPAGSYAWGTSRMGAALGPATGSLVRVAIVDTGIAERADLNIAKALGRNFVEGEDENEWQDEEGHGTHCAGVIGGIAGMAPYWGVAGRAELVPLRIFGGADGGGYSGDIADAIDFAVENGCHLVNLSLTGPAHGSIRQAVERAQNAGVLCVAATGNEGGPVGFPAAYSAVAAVGAVGTPNTYPDDSVHKDAETSFVGPPGLYLASFSNRGDEVNFAAPGVAIPSLLPHAQIGAWDGTSMACPHVTGVAALALEVLPNLLAAQADARTGLVIDRLVAASQDLGLARELQGAGMPLASKILGMAQPPPAPPVPPAPPPAGP
jgi:subtilisin